jgi:hypothetical protein
VPISLERVGLNDLDRREPLPQRWNEVPILLDADQPLRSLGEGLGESSGARTDLQNRFLGRRSNRIGDAGQDSRIRKEVLAEALLGFPRSVRCEGQARSDRRPDDR